MRFAKTREIAAFLCGLFLITYCFLSFFENDALAAESAPAKLDQSVAKLTFEGESIAPGTPFTVAIDLTLSPGWHTYAEDPGDAGIPTTAAWTLPKGFVAGPIQFPAHEDFKEDQFVTHGYKDHVRLPVTITPPKALAEKDVTLGVAVTYLVCNEICIPQIANLSIALPVSDAVATSTPAAAPAEFSGFALVLLFAFLGGAVLNLMPCVFPVLSLKVLAVAQAAHSTARIKRAEGMAYTLGVLTCFALISLALMAIRAAGGEIGWGFQMQSPPFVSFLALLLFVIGLNLSGLFELPVLLGNVGTQLTREPTLKGSFATGVLATLVATPCTAPFMASAVGYALATDSKIVAFLVFQALGLGLAAPFLLICFIPAIAKLLPRPGAWMERFRNFLAFPMYAAGVWLVWVLASQTGANGVATLLLASVFIAFALWLRKGWLSIILMLVIGISAVAMTPRMQTKVASPLVQHGEAFDPARIEMLRASGTPLFVDATATWCITCQVNYQSTLKQESVQKAFKDRNIIFMVADWTNADPRITNWLSSFGRSGVPLYVYYPPYGEPKVLPQILTPAIVLEAIN